MTAPTLKPRMAAVRSKLFVPGSRPELFAKAFHSAADALSFDLEDSVAAAAKDEARRQVAAFLKGERASTKIFIVRVNADPELLRADLHAVVVPGLDVINLPKVESADDVVRVAALIESLEANSERPVGILANIETAKGLRLAYEIASAHPRVVGLQLGFVDLSMQCSIDQTNVTALNAARLAVRLAAAEAGIAAFDGAYSNVKDADGFRAQAEDARALGMNSKSCIHPTQVALANEVFAPSPELIAESLRVVAAAAQADAAGTGAFLLDGKMIDAPIAERARRVVERAKMYGLVSSGDEA